jgi:hypothetical protein
VIASVLGKLGSHRELTWHLIGGNHDPMRQGGVWDAALALKPAANVRVHQAAEPTEIAPGVVLLPAPLRSKAMASDPTAWMDAADTPRGALRIGIAHGSIRGFGSLGEAAVPIDPERARAARLAYLALGDWHGALQVNPLTWYCGTPEPDGFAENAPGHVLVVRLGDGPAEVTRVATGRFRWMARSADVISGHELKSIAQEIAERGPEAAALIVNLTLRGSTTVAGSDALDGSIAALQRLVFALRVDRSLVDVSAGELDIASLGDPTLAGIAGRLAARARGEGDAQDRRVAGLALRRLVGLGRTMSGGTE